MPEFSVGRRKNLFTFAITSKYKADYFNDKGIKQP